MIFNKNQEQSSIVKNAATLKVFFRNLILLEEVAKKGDKKIVIEKQQQILTLFYSEQGFIKHLNELVHELSKADNFQPNNIRYKRLIEHCMEVLNKFSNLMNSSGNFMAYIKKGVDLMNSNESIFVKNKEIFLLTEQAMIEFKKIINEYHEFEKALEEILSLELLTIASDEEINKTIDMMFKADQACRFDKWYHKLLHPMPKSYAGLNAFEIDQYNYCKLKFILERKPLSHFKDRTILRKIFFIVQHARTQLEFIQVFLEDFKAHPLADLENVAYLTDNVLVLTGREQLYGSQNDEPAEVFAMRPIKDAQVIKPELKDSIGNLYGELTSESINLIDERRKQFGLKNGIVYQYHKPIKRAKIKKKTGNALMFVELK